MSPTLVNNPLIISQGKRNTRPNIDYRCATCGKRKTRDTLFARRVQWLTMGNRSKVVRGRVTYWVCRSCMEKDPDYQREGLVDSPGYQDTELARRAIMQRPEPEDTP